MHWLRTEGGLYWTVFVLSFLGVAVWESLQPWRELSEPVERRWGRHALLVFLSYGLSALLIPLSPVLLAVSLSNRWGLLHQSWLATPARWILAILILDLARFAVHRAMHAVHLLWRVHQVHHSDHDFDVSTSVRAHPVEVIVFQLTSLATVAILAPPPGAVLVQQLLSAFESFFSHANASLPPWLQRTLGWLLYTCDTHRVHHSADFRMQNSNYGDIFPWWDMLFRTYLPAAADPKMTIGVDEPQLAGRSGFLFLLKQPFLPNRQ